MVIGGVVLSLAVCLILLWIVRAIMSLNEGDAGEYLLSPRDLNTLEMMPELIRAGITSFKIEGRMKRPEYVAVAVDTYRRAIDACIG